MPLLFSIPHAPDIGSVENPQINSNEILVDNLIPINSVRDRELSFDWRFNPLALRALPLSHLRWAEGEETWICHLHRRYFLTPPALRATSPISAHRRAEEEVVVKASSFTKVRENGTTCHTLQYCGISLSTKDSRPYILFTSIEFYQTAIEKFWFGR